MLLGYLLKDHFLFLKMPLGSAKIINARLLPDKHQITVDGKFDEKSL